MIIRIELTEEMKYKEYKISKRKGGRVFCRIPVAYEVDEDGNTKRYLYKEIYGVDRNDVALKRALFIDEQIRESTDRKITASLFIIQMKEWLYSEKFGTVKSTSFDRLEGILLHQILPAVQTLPHSKLSEIDSKDIKTILKHNLDQGYSYSTLLKIYRFLNEFFRYQHFSGNIARNPVQQVKMYKKEYVQEVQAAFREKREELQARKNNGDQLTPQEETIAASVLRSQDHEEPRFLTDDEIARLEKAVALTYKNGKSIVKQAEFFLFMLNTGLRAGEALALKYSDFDHENRTVLIGRNMTASKERTSDGQPTKRRIVKEGSTKTTASMATLPINRKASEIIQRMQQKEPVGYNGYIIHNSHRLPIEPRALEKRFYSLLKLAQIPQTGLHTLRHTYASKLYELTNGDTKFVSEMLRHKSVSFTAQTYIHLESKYKRNRVHDFVI